MMLEVGMYPQTDQTKAAGVLRILSPGYPCGRDPYFSLNAHFTIGETMPNIDPLHERGSALENQFFAELDARLLAELKIKQEHDNLVGEFARITGFKDEKTLESIYKLGVTPQSFAALRVFPMVAMAWADGMLDEAEIVTVKTLASTHFDLKQSPAGQLLSKWLESEPSSEQFESWETYAKTLVSSMPAQAAEELKKTLIGEIKTIASSSGGLLGWAAISAGEHKALNRIEAALTRA
jgi:uncharacterized tellurite resistance protein B-like protein